METPKTNTSRALQYGVYYDGTKVDKWQKRDIVKNISMQMQMLVLPQSYRGKLISYDD